MLITATLSLGPLPDLGSNRFFYLLNMAYNPLLSSNIPDNWGVVKTSINALGCGVSAAAYPSFVVLDASIRVPQTGKSFSCPAIRSASGSLSMLLPSGYDGYRSCTCDAGYSGSSGVCSACPAGRYAPPPSFPAVATGSNATGAPATACLGCPPGSFSPAAGAAQCTPAPAGQYVATGASSTLDCPSGATCSGGRLFAGDNFWWALLPDNRTARTWPCSKGRCRSGRCSAGRPGSAVEDAAGYASNTMCGSCAAPLIEFAGVCMSCKEWDAPALVAAWLYTMALVVFVDVLSNDGRQATVNIFSFYACVVSQVVPTTSVFYFVSKLINLHIDLGAVEFTGVLCLGPIDGVAIEALYLLTPAILLLNLALLVLFRRYCRPPLGRLRDRLASCCCCTCCCRAPPATEPDAVTVTAAVAVLEVAVQPSDDPGPSPQAVVRVAPVAPEAPKAADPLSSEAIMRTAVALVVTTYASVSESVLSLLQCSSVNGQQLLYAYPTVDCRWSNPRYLPWALAALLMLLLVVVGFPLFLTFVSWKKLKVFRKVSSDTACWYASFFSVFLSSRKT
jgi:hypothetical protein